METLWLSTYEREHSIELSRINPTPFGSNGQMDYALLCDDGNQNFSIRHMPIE